MSGVVPLRTPQPRLDAVAIEAVRFIPEGMFEAIGPCWRWRFGKLADGIPAWATRVHMNAEDFSRLIATVKPDV